MSWACLSRELGPARRSRATMPNSRGHEAQLNAGAGSRDLVPRAERCDGTLIACRTTASLFPSASTPPRPGPPTRKPSVPREVFLLPSDDRDLREQTDGPRPRRIPRLRHHPARRRPAGGAQPVGGRQADHRAPARRPRRGLHRGRLAGGQPQGHGVLPPRRRRAGPAAREARGLRRHPAAGRGRRRRPDGRGAARLRRERGHAGRQVARPARRPGPADHPGGEPRDGPRHRQPPPGRGTAGVPRRRALLRRLPRQP